MADVEQQVVSEVAQTTPSAAEVPGGPDRFSLPWWPFLAYLGVWVVSAGVAAWFLVDSPYPGSMVGSSAYPYVLRASLVLTAAGPVIALSVWIVAWAYAGRGRRKGLLSTSLLRGGVVTLLGVVVWWCMLIVVDRFRLDRLW